MLAILGFRCRCSSEVEQRTRNAWAVGSNPTIGFMETAIKPLALAVGISGGDGLLDLCLITQKRLELNHQWES